MPFPCVVGKNPCLVASFCLAVSRFFATFSINNLPTIVFHLQFFNLCSNVLFVKQGVHSAVHSSPNMFMIVAYTSVLNTCLPRCVCVCVWLDKVCQTKYTRSSGNCSQSVIEANGCNSAFKSPSVIIEVQDKSRSIKEINFESVKKYILNLF